MASVSDIIPKARSGDLDGLRGEMSGWDVERLARRYLQGMCGPFAVAIHDRTGWPTVAVFDAPGGMWESHPRHVGCQAPDGTYADARGCGLDEAAFMEGYRPEGGVPLVARPFGPDAIRSNYRARTEADWILAAEHLDRILPGLDDAVHERGGVSGPLP